MSLPQRFVRIKIILAWFLVCPMLIAQDNYLPHPDLRGDDLLLRCQKNLEQAQVIKEQLKALPSDQSGTKALFIYNEILILLNDSLSEASLISQVHPKTDIRTAAESCEQEASSFATDLSLDKDVFAALLTTDKAQLDDQGLRMLEHTLRDFKRSGVDKDDETRAAIKTLEEKLVTISQQFSQNISKDLFYIELDDAAQLDGLPSDYIEAHRLESGKYRITTAYPDYVPFMKYAKNDAARKALRFKYLNRGQDNALVLDDMIKTRHELAALLGYDSYADFVLEDKMIKEPAAAYDFIDKVSARAKNGADHELQELLAFKRKSISDATQVEGHESSFLEEAYKKERFKFDSQAVRPYFPYNQVRDGLMRITSELFAIRYELVANTNVWHESVETYDVFDAAGKLGRIYLDMHPRKDKYSHAAQFTVRTGINGLQYPEGALVCNFPDPKEGDGYALMEHSDVQTFFHEFGHLLHHLFAGRKDWVSFSGVATEWDFVEAPSQLLEEWAWSPQVLATFARHYQTGEVIPSELVENMRAAEEFGKAIAARQQMFYAALSLNYYNLDPATFDPMNLLKDLQSKYSYFPYEEGTHFIYSFGHLDGYSAMYYTYMWSLSLAKDLFEPFREHGLMDKDTAARYRDLVLAAGGSQDAIELVEQFLGRPFQFDAFEKWLTSGGE